MLIRMDGAQRLHLFAFAPEIDTVLKAFKRSISGYSDALRVAFDNDEYGQDYASDNSWSGTINLYYNTLFPGTPKAMRRFYPDVEDGLVSRVLFVTHPDQFGKPIPVWGEMTEKQKAAYEIGLTRLSEISLQGDQVQADHVMKLEFLNKALDLWLKSQQVEAVKSDDRTRDAFCRRSAVVGFRAGMLAWFLWGEKNTPTIRKNVINFATWVANNMLNQHLLCFDLKEGGSNVNRLESVYKQLPETFTRKQLESELAKIDSTTPSKIVLYKWKLLGIVETVEEGRSGGHKAGVTFKKTQK